MLTVKNDGTTIFSLESSTFSKWFFLTEMGVKISFLCLSASIHYFLITCCLWLLKVPLVLQLQHSFEPFFADFGTLFCVSLSKSAI